METKDDVHRLVQQRIDKAERIRDAGLDPYSNDFRPELVADEIKQRYGALSAEELEGVNTIHTLAGRLMGVRTMGKMAFLRLLDRTGEIQVMVQKNI